MADPYNAATAAAINTPVTALNVPASPTLADGVNYAKGIAADVATLPGRMLLAGQNMIARPLGLPTVPDGGVLSQATPFLNAQMAQAPSNRAQLTPSATPERIAAANALPPLLNAQIPALGQDGVKTMVNQPAAPATGPVSLQALQEYSKWPTYLGPQSQAEYEDLQKQKLAAATPPPTIGADGQYEQVVNRPPLVNGEIPVGDKGGGVGMPQGPSDTQASSGGEGEGFREGFRDNTLFDPFGQQGGNSAQQGMIPLPGGGKMANGRFLDPRDAIASGYNMQLAYQMQSMRNLNQMAGSGSALGFHSRMAALAQAIGANNFGQVQGAGADSWNNAQAGMTNTETLAGTTQLGDILRYLTGNAQVGEQHYEASTGSVQTGTALQSDRNGITYPVAVYGQRPAAAGMQPTPYETKPRYVPDQVYQDKLGNKAVYQKDGTFKPVAG